MRKVMISWTFAAEGCPRSRPSKYRDFWYSTPSPCKREGWFSFSTLLFAWGGFSTYHPLFQGLCSRKLPIFQVERFLSNASKLASFANIWWGKKHDAASTSFFKDFGFLHGTQMSMGSGMSRPVQKDTIWSLWMLPGWTPWEPAFAIWCNSSCCAPSSIASSANIWMVQPLTLPWLQRQSKAVANALS